MQSQKTSGRLIAFEGAPDVVATQLGLLPASPHILVLPTVQAYLGDIDGLVATANGQALVSDKTPFDGRSFIKRVHEAACVRNRAASDFLRFPDTSTSRPEQKLVFLQGGTAASHALCVEALCKYDAAAGGDLQHAALLFEDLVAGGLDGLDASIDAPRSAQRSRDLSSASSGHYTYARDNAFSDTDPSTRAMRAADALDRETESLQPANDFLLDFNTRPRRHSLSLPIHDDRLPNFTRRISQASDYSRSSSVCRMRSGYGGDAAECFLSSPLTSPSSAIFPPSMRPEAVAAAMTMAMAIPLQGQPRGRARWRTQSLERRSITVGSRQPSRRRRGSPGECGINFLLSRDPSSRPVSGTTTDSVLLLQSTMPRPASAMPRLSTDTRERQSKPGQTRQSPLPQSRLQVGSAVEAKSAYVDRSTDATGPSTTASDPVLPLVEDLVVFFHDGLPHPALDVAMERSRSMASGNGRIGDEVFHASPALNARQQQNPQGTRAHRFGTPQTPTTPPGGFLLDSTLSATSIAAPLSSPDEYNLFAPQEFKHRMVPEPSRSSQPSRSTAMPTAKARHPPTPAQTPPPPVEEQQRHSFLSFSATEHQTSVAKHNALRAALREYLIPQDEAEKENKDNDGNEGEHMGADALSAHLLSAGYGLWTPLLDNDNSRVDLILALGIQKGVQPVLANTVVARLAALGPKSSTAWNAYSGRLNIGYLVATALQARTAPSIASSKAFAQSLATLIVPQLDLYLRMHPSLHFLLLDYPDELFDVVLALQQLLGRSVLQVAALLTPGVEATRSPSRTDNAGLCNRADLVLPATATEIDIVEFVASVRRRLESTSASSPSSPWKAASVMVRPSSLSDPPVSPMSPMSRVSFSASVQSQSSTQMDASTIVAAPAMAVSMLSYGSHLVPKTVQVHRASAITRREPSYQSKGIPDVTSSQARNGKANEVDGKKDEDEDGEEDDMNDDTDNYMDMRRLMPLFLRDQSIAMRAVSESAGFQGKSNHLTGASDPEKSASLPPASNACRRVGCSWADGSLQAYNLNGDASPSNSSNGQKALKWLGLE